MSVIKAMKILDSEQREMALKVVDEVYFREKNWIRSIEDEIPENIAEIDNVSWMLVTLNDKPAGVLRLYYDPPLQFPADFEVTLNQEIDLEKIAETCRFVEIGRFMILPRYRKNVFVALKLMQKAFQEVVERDYTHFITDVFKGEVNSPLEFHTRILGFEIVGSHLHGELNCSLTRIILTLDILKAYQRLRENRNRIYWALTEGVRDLLDKKVAANSPDRRLAA